jgi:3-deoxy-D-arabino-heptulosonate 7-phosphate (DAHP) synthase class II
MIDKTANASDGAYDSEMAYGWAYNLTAWETIFAKASRSKKEAQAVLQLISEMEQQGVSEFPKVRSYMREVIRAANATIRNDDLQRLLKRKR